MGQSFAVRVGLGMVGGVKGTDWLVAQARGASTALGLVVIGVVIVAGVCARSPRVRLFTLVAAAYSAVCFVVPVWLRDVASVMQIGTVRLAGRYQAVPVLLLTSALLVLADHFAREGSTRTLRHSTWKTKSLEAWPRRSVVAVTVCAALLIPSWVADFRGPNQRSSGPPWATEVAKATAVCRRGAAVATLSIDPPYWTVRLPCRVVAQPG